MKELETLSLARYLEKQIREDLKRKMVFMGGPRQVGKTTLSLKILSAKDKSHSGYLNWDNLGDRARIRKAELPFEEKLIILDEIHKFKKWRGLIKGLFDKTFPQTNYLVTGSARLDYYRFGGDSLQGRYHYLRLHPWSINELTSHPTARDLEQLLKFGGFPEPLFGASEIEWRRWQREYFERVTADDIVNLEHVKDMGSMSLLLDELPQRVGSPLSVKNLREVLEVSHATVERWLQIFERLYLLFRIPPYGTPKFRAVKKEQKLYLYDWSRLTENGPRFENLVASQLLKYCHFIEDTEGYSMELRFIRDVDGREIDFVVLQDRKPLFAVEVKSGEKNLNSAIPYYSARTNIPNFYQVHLGVRDQSVPDVRGRIIPWLKFCKLLNMP